MAKTNIIQFFKGLATNRTGQTPASGEPLWVTDDKLLYVGDGTTAGGVRVSTFGYDWTNETNNLVTTGNIQGQDVTGTRYVFGGLNVIAGNTNLTVDNQFYMGTQSATVPSLNFDLNDYLEYSRAGNNWGFVVNLTEVVSISGTQVDLNIPLFIKEQAAASADVAAYGQLWVKTATPNELWFTDDGGTDHQLTPPSTGGGGGITWVYKTSNYTAVAGDGVLANISSGTITLPATLVVGDPVVINNMHSSTLIVADNGHAIRYKGVSYTANITLEQGETVQLVAATTGIMEIT